MERQVTFSIGGRFFSLCGGELCRMVRTMPGFGTFCVEDAGGRTGGTVADAAPEEVPRMVRELYPFVFEDVEAVFGSTEKGYLLVMRPAGREPLYMWTKSASSCCRVAGNKEPYLLRFALWVAYGLLFLPDKVLAVHSSCIVYNGRAVLFLGESGTGKSTHTRLWREHIPGSELLNDDSPVIAVEDGRIMVYGSPWSGKTPCYRAERCPLAAVVRLSQARENHIRKLSVLQAYGAVHPSCAPEFAYASELYDHVSEVLDVLLSTVPCYHLACLPDRAAAELSFQTVFDE